MKRYINASQENGKKFYLNSMNENLVMLNMLRFKDIADYSKFPDLDPGKTISGSDAYKIYIEKALPFLDAVGSKIIFEGEAETFLIGPEEARRDLVLLVSHVSKKVFLEFAKNEAYLKIAGHRNAALEDSRLLPIKVN